MNFYLKDYLKLTKSGIVFFTLISAGAGYVIASNIASISGQITTVEFPFIWLMVGLYLVSSGSFSLNQAYEWRLDTLMQRTKNRPVPAGKITAKQAVCISVMGIVSGLFILLALNPLTAGLTAITVVLYNFFYTIFWKKTWIFAAVPGAIPGALPVTIGYSVASYDIFSLQSIYLFFVLFLWQMPHFWSLTLQYKEDYRLANLPVLPIHVGTHKTLYYMGFYLISYLGLALMSPLIFKMNFIYIFVFIPFCVKVGIEFIKFYKQLKWKPFFMWLNLSVLIFLWGPACDFWIHSFIK